MNNQDCPFTFDVSKNAEDAFWTRFGVDFHYCVRDVHNNSPRIVLGLLQKQPGVLSFFVEDAMEEFLRAADHQGLEVSLSCVPLQRKNKPKLTPASMVLAMHKLIGRYKQFGFEVYCIDEGDGTDLEDIRAELGRSPDPFYRQVSSINVQTTGATPCPIN